MTLLRVARRVRFATLRSPRKWAGAVLLGLVLLVVMIRANDIMSFYRQKRLASHPERSPQAAASLWYERMLRLLGRQGSHKSPAHTPAEFVTTISDPGLQKVVAGFVADYENARFGESVEAAKRLPQRYGEIAEMSKR